MGTPEFALPALKALIAHDYEILAVVTQPDRPKGRGRKLAVSPVKELALTHHIDVLQPEKASNDPFCAHIQNMGPDLIIVVAFGQILSKEFLRIPKWGAVNIHASLLPKYRGAAPIQRAILNNESRTGLTIMHMDEGMDTGPIIYQTELLILKDETAGQLHDRLALLAGEVIIKSLADMADKPVKEIPQDDSAATYASKIQKKDTRVDWTPPASEISCRIRALDPSPGAYTLLDGKEVKLFASTVIEENGTNDVPGRVLECKEDEIHVQSGRGIVGIRAIQVPGKKRLMVSDFLRGFPLSEGTVLGK
ncbi:MAG: methionyl-tRNA formyltransferase [Deltaproteobacteria bacterium]|nr:methionyl-tRNA formyltransferase [Deltaproteobacteria bacterium]